jgi:cytoskeletal protein CcmA (bactofilin family)
MFNKDNNQINIKEAETIIGPTIKVKGNFHGQGNIIIEGLVEGSIKTDKFLLIGDKSKINANIEAKDAKIGGEVKGNINISGYLEISSSAKISGEIKASQISVARGAILNGQLIMGKTIDNPEPQKKV